MLRCASLCLLLTFPTAAAGQSTDAADSFPARSLTLTGGVGNALGWFGVQGERYLPGDRVSVFGGLGYTPEVDNGASGVTLAGGARGYTAGQRHRGFLELSVSQISVESFCRDACSRQYGPGLQAGYQFAGRGGFTFMVSIGVGYALGVPEGSDPVMPLLGLGLGYTWRR